MTIDLTDTTTGAIQQALTEARRRMGGPASGMVLTLIIVTDEAAQYDAVRAASQAGREHPSRIVAVISRKPKGRVPAGRRDPGGRDRSRRDHLAPHVRPARPARRLGGRAAARPRRSRRHLVARRGAPLAPRGSARLGRTAPGDGRGGQRGAQGLAAGPGQGLPARRHRPELDPGDVLAFPARRYPGPALPRAAQRRGAGRAGQPERGPDRGLARIAAWHRGAARRVPRSRDHRGQLRHAGRQGRAVPARRQERHPVLARPTGAPGSAAPARGPRPDRRGAAQARARRGLRRNPARAGRQVREAQLSERARGHRAPGRATAGRGRRRAHWSPGWSTRWPPAAPRRWC